MQRTVLSLALCATALASLPAQLTPHRTLRAHAAWVRCLAWSPDGTLATGGQDRLICLWNSQGTLLRRLELQPGGG